MSITSVFERVKSRDINWRRVFFVGVFVALFLEFYLNFFGTVNMQYFVNFQADSEDLVLGKIRDAISGDIFGFRMVDFYIEILILCLVKGHICLK